jgi:hypothetical protein
MNVHGRRCILCFVLLLFFLQCCGFAFPQSSPDALKGVTHSSSLTFVLRNGICLDGPISKIDAKAITILQNQKPPITVQREDLLQVNQGDALLFSARSSWADVAAAHVYPREAFVLKVRSGKIIKGRPVKVSADSLTLKHGLITTQYSKSEIVTVDYLRLKPETDGFDYFAQEAPALLFFYPETYYRLLGLEGRLSVRLYDASIPDGGAVLQCSRR